jgi:hypothetical protein
MGNIAAKVRRSIKIPMHDHYIHECQDEDDYEYECQYKGCNHQTINDGKYCKTHKCIQYGCKLPVSIQSDCCLEHSTERAISDTAMPQHECFDDFCYYKVNIGDFYCEFHKCKYDNCCFCRYQNSSFCSQHKH